MGHLLSVAPRLMHVVRSRVIVKGAHQRHGGVRPQGTPAPDVTHCLPSAQRAARLNVDPHPLHLSCGTQLHQAPPYLQCIAGL